MNPQILDNTGSPLTPPVTSSRTLGRLEHYPNTVCVNCQNAIWHQTDAKKFQVYCKLMFSLIDIDLLDCDGQDPPAPPATL